MGFFPDFFLALGKAKESTAQRCGNCRVVVLLGRVIAAGGSHWGGNLGCLGDR